MVIVNNKEYTNYDIVTSWNDFSFNFNGHKKIGIAPFITFNIENISIWLELTFEDVMFKQLKLNNKVNIKDFIIDILYCNDRGWISISNNNFSSFITSINEDNFRLEITLISSRINFNIDTIIKLF